MITKEQIRAALAHVRYPGSGQDIVSNGMLQDDIQIEGNAVSFSLRFTRERDPFEKSVVKAAEKAIATYVGEDVLIEGRIQSLFPEPKKKKEHYLSSVKNIVAVFSGKGGVGKSTVTANLAVALSLQGYKVGILDADIYGPSMPKMFAVEDAKPVAIQLEDGSEAIEPVNAYNDIKLLSIGFFTDPSQALVWRGSMAGNALSQLLLQGYWGELDYLLIDMPPGTSDIHLTLVQSVGITGSVIVTTPQEIALVDARKAIDMFVNEKIHVPVLGLVENMAWFTPAELPENRYYIFGKEGGVRLAEDLHIPLLARLPLVQSVCEGGDNGLPVAAYPDSILGAYFSELASNVVLQVKIRNEQEPPTQKVEVH